MHLATHAAKNTNPHACMQHTRRHASTPAPVMRHVVQHLRHDHKAVPPRCMLRRQRRVQLAPCGGRAGVRLQRQERAPVARLARHRLNLELRQPGADLQAGVGGGGVKGGVRFGDVVLWGMGRCAGGSATGLLPAHSYPTACASTYLPRPPAAPLPPTARRPRTSTLAARLPVPPPTSTMHSGSRESQVCRRSSRMYFAMERPNQGRNSSAGVSQSTRRSLNSRCSLRRYSRCPTSELKGIGSGSRATGGWGLLK